MNRPSSAFDPLSTGTLATSPLFLRPAPSTNNVALSYAGQKFKYSLSITSLISSAGAPATHVKLLSPSSHPSPAASASHAAALDGYRFPTPGAPR